MIAELLAHLPVPIRAWTISDTVPDTQTKPGQGSQRQKRQISSAGFAPEPAKQIKHNHAGMEQEEEDVER